MIDIQKQIETVLSDEKFVFNGNFASKVYQDEPILITAPQIECYTPSEYLAMRRIAKGKDAYHESDAKIFYDQGKFMESFEDDYDYQGEFYQNFPTYESMNTAQLRGYFSWRTKVRRGIIEKTPLSFVYVYIYELINQIGVHSPEEGFYALRNFWTIYKDIDYRINRYIKLWLKDYVVYNNLDKILLEDLTDTNMNNAVLTLLSNKSHGADEVFSAINSLSTYNMENSRFFKLYPEDVKNVVKSVYSALSDHYDKYCEKPLSESLLGKFYTSSYVIFSSAVFYDRGCQKELVYEINELSKYTCNNGNWRCERFFCYGGKSMQIGRLLKTIDSLMRQKYSFKSTLVKAGKTSNLMQRIVGKAIDSYREKLRINATPKIEIDVSKLQDIRNAAWETQNKLLVEELEETDAPEFFEETPVEMTEPENDASLSDIECQFIRCLLYGRPYDSLVRSKFLPLSVLVDAVNEHFFDRFGDAVIVEMDDRPELAADYIEELKGIIKE